MKIWLSLRTKPSSRANEQTHRKLTLADHLNADENTLAEHMLEPETMAAAFNETRKLLRVDVGEPQLLKIVESAISIATDLWHDLEAESPTTEGQKGCSRCCGQLVS